MDGKLAAPRAIGGQQGPSTGFLQLPNGLPQFNVGLGGFQGGLTSSLGSQGPTPAVNNTKPDLPAAGSSVYQEGTLTLLGQGTIYSKNLEPEQIKSVESFLEGIEFVRQDVVKPTNTDPRRDEDLIVIAVLKELTLRYFSHPLDNQNLSGAVLKSKTTAAEFISQLSNIRFKEKNTDMILIMLKQLSDNLLEILLNPNTSAPQMNLMKSGKSSINAVLFLVKGYFQQIRTMKSIYCEDGSGTDSLGLLAQEYLRMVRPVVAVTLELCAPEPTKPNQIPAIASAFQLNPGAKVGINDAAGPAQQLASGQHMGFQLNQNFVAEMDAGNFNPSMDYTGNWLYLQKGSAHLKRLSFEFPNPNSMRSEHQFGGVPDLDGALKESGHNMNKFVSTLLKKKNADE